jgi:hypothetical protein
MQTIAFSGNAVALLRYRVKKWPMKVKERDLPAYQELVEAGIMVPHGSDFQFTEEGYVHREELLREAEDRIERERYEATNASFGSHTGVGGDASSSRTRMALRFFESNGPATP